MTDLAHTMKTETETLAIEYKTKVRRFANGEEYIDFKRKVSRSDCAFNVHSRKFGNSDLFPAILSRAYAAACDGREWARLTDLPERVSVDNSGFLAVVTVDISGLSPHL